MKITVVTPSYNQGQYLEATIESVLSQGIRDLEYIIMDGGSTDGSVEIIKKYAKYLSYWQSTRDGGQTQAIMDGFERATGEVLCWLNSDDRYELGALALAEKEFETDSKVQLLYGDYIVAYPDGREIPKPKISFDFNICLHAFLMIPQASSFWRASLYKRIGGLNPEYQYSFDYDFFLRAGYALRDEPGSIRHIQKYLSKFRAHDTSKSVSCIPLFLQENVRIKQPFGISKHRLIRQVRSKYELCRCVWRFWAERRVLVYRKEKGKA
jgi:glycosyltransferase involved in cell wall biosynthesis